VHVKIFGANVGVPLINIDNIMSTINKHHWVVVVKQPTNA
jgi:hypothetical protein